MILCGIWQLHCNNNNNKLLQLLTGAPAETNAYSTCKIPVRVRKILLGKLGTDYNPYLRTTCHALDCVLRMLQRTTLANSKTHAEIARATHQQNIIIFPLQLSL